MLRTSTDTNLAVTLREAMGPGFAFNSGAAMERLAAQTSGPASTQGPQPRPR